MHTQTAPKLAHRLKKIGKPRQAHAYTKGHARTHTGTHTQIHIRIQTIIYIQGHKGKHVQAHTVTQAHTCTLI